MLVIGKEVITIEDVVRVARFKERVVLSKEAKDIIQTGRNKFEEEFVETKVMYGVSTGFGALRNISIPLQDRKQVPYNLIFSHATGVGERLSEDIVRAVILLKIITLSKGYSCVRLSVVEALINLLNKDIFPFVPSKGSVGASGDLVPLAHIALVLIGKGKVIENNSIIDCEKCSKKNGVTPISLMDKEGLALINGTQVMTAIAAIVCYDTRLVFTAANIAGALSLEALRGNVEAFKSIAINLRPHKGQSCVSRDIENLIRNSGLYKLKSRNIQDSYSLRCIPQVHGASFDALFRAEETVLIEINSVTDNPLYFQETSEILCQGNFHGQPIALSMDYLKIAICEMANISERRLNQLLDSHLSGLPAFLAPCAGVNSGLMITQYTAAALVSENKVLAHPACVDSIPTSANQEDHVSMGTIAARQAKEILYNVCNVIAIEIFAALQAIDCRENWELGVGTKRVYDYIRASVMFVEKDRILYEDIEKICKMIKEGILQKQIIDIL